MNRLAYSTAGFAAILIAGSASAQTYDRIIAFGDSFSDNGSVVTAPPDPPYWQGRFSNGPVWVEDLGFSNITTFDGPATGNADYALGGAVTDSDPSHFGLGYQLQTYQANGGGFGASDVVTFWGGANDLLNTLAASNPSTAIGPAAQAAAANVATLGGKVAAAGAGTVLVLNMMDIGATPSYTPASLGAASSQLLTTGSNSFNSALRADLGAVAIQHPGTNFILMDVGALYQALATSPSAFGLINDRCISGSGTVCSSPDTYFFYDGFHPTEAAQALIAKLAQDYLYYGDRGASSGLEGEAALAARRRALDADFGIVSGGRGSVASTGLGLEIDGEDDKTDARALVPTADSDAGDVRILLTHGVGGGQAAAIFSLGKGKVDAAPLSFDETTYGGDLVYGWRGATAFVNLAAGATRSSYDIRRASGVGALLQTANTDGWTWGGGAQAGFDLKSGAFVVSPRLQLSFSDIFTDAYEEIGVAARHMQAGRGIDATTLDASVRLERDLAPGASGFLEAGYEGLVGYSADPVVTGLADNTALPLSRYIGRPYGSDALVSAGLSWRLGTQISAQARYTGRIGDLTSNGGAIEVRIGF